MTYTVFRLEYKLWGFDPLGYHLFNIVLHLINALLLWRLLACMRLPGAWMVSAVFALHPVHVESVAWVTELKNLLMTFFAFLSLWAWMAWMHRSQRGERAWSIYLLSLFLYVLALFSKTTACTLPVVLVLLLWLRRMPIDARRWIQIFPYFAFGLIMGCLTLWWEHVYQGLHPMAGDLNLFDRVLIACRALWFYLGKLVLPVDLTFSYPRWEMSAADFSSYWGLFACLMAGWMLWRWRDKTGRGPIAAMAFFVVTLSPTLGLISLFTFYWTFVADHYQYMASIGPIALAVAAACHIMNRNKKRYKTAMGVTAAAVLLALGMLTFRQTPIYENEETLWRDTLDKNPSSWLAHVNLGAFIGRQGRVDEAVEHYLKALDIHPESEHAHFNLGNVLLEKGQLGRAIHHYHRALQIKPNSPEALHNLGFAYSRQGEYDQAVEAYRKALQFRPGYLIAHKNLALDLVEMGRYGEALEHFRMVMSLDPQSPAAHRDLGNVLMALDRREEAFRYYYLALDLADRAGDNELASEIRDFLNRVELLKK
jgi:Flp pilus assembly protein TadD